MRKPLLIRALRDKLFQFARKGRRIFRNAGWRGLLARSMPTVGSFVQGIGFSARRMFRKARRLLFGKRRIRIAAVTMVYNEALILPYFLRHYGYLDEIHVLYETDSTDESLEILKRARNVIVTNCHIEGGLDDIEKIRLMNRTLHRLKADWVYVIDPDEFIFPQNESAIDFLGRQDCDVVRSTMYQVYRHRTDGDLNPLLPPIPQRVHGDPDLFSNEKQTDRPLNALYIKPNIVRPSSKVRLLPGAHAFQGRPHVSAESFAGAHWQMADPSIALRRRMERKARISKRNRELQMGWQHFNVQEEGILEECRNHLDDPVIDVLSGYEERDPAERD